MRISTWAIALIIAAITAVASVGGTFVYFSTTARQKLVVATTTSLFDTGLLDEVETQFEATHNIDVYFISVGTGVAIQFAQRGDADMIFVHAPSNELAFLQGGYGVDRKVLAYNFFVIVGPKADPAQISGSSPTEALSKIASAGRNSQTSWVSRGDESGTNVKEKSLWKAAGFNWTKIRDETSWFIETGSGMGNTLKTTNQLNAYTLTDIGTFLAYSSASPSLIPNLVELVTQGSDLLNVYSAIACNATRQPEANFEGAITFIKYMTSEEGQKLIEQYGMSDYGKHLFYPAVELLKSNTDPTMAQMIRNYAFFNGSECPSMYRLGHPELYDQG